MATEVTKTDKKTYFGVPIYTDDRGWKYVLDKDIEVLPFFDFWKEKSMGSTCGRGVDGINLNYLHDWEKFCKIFITQGI